MLNLYNANNHNGNGIDKGSVRVPLNKNGKKANFEKYQDPSGDFPASAFKWSFWYIKNRVLLFKILIGTLIGLSVIFWSLSLWKWGDYLIFGLPEMQNLSRESATFIDYTGLHPAFTAQPLQVIGTQVHSGSAGKIDAVAEMTNPNSKFIVYFDYYFVFGAEKTPAQKGFLLAGESRPIVQLGLDGAVYSGSASLTLENISWRRISGHEALDPSAWQKERLNFVVSDFQYLSRGSALAGDSSAVQFKLKNDSAYGYASPKFLIGLFQNQSLVGVVPYELDAFVAQETREIDARNFSPSLNVNEAVVYPL
ncbi:hypothetical protein KKC87_03015, partial [Patescibacteria group bacterium]|nr:hypothetical protein [Patescibacteria group bacterium]